MPEIQMHRYICLLGLLWGSTLEAQEEQRLQTASTVLVLEAGPQSPRLKEIRAVGQKSWINRTPEFLLDHVDIDGQTVPVQWSLNSAASGTQGRSVRFVYEAASPHLRLIWEWSARAAYGPIEHQIHIENLDSRTIWLPFQDSFIFDFAVPEAEPLKHFFVEKGADTPSANGTHEVSLLPGYNWVGTSSTYAHPIHGEAREIIPWFLIQRSTSQRDGWYVGIEFSGRTRLAISRQGESLKGAAGLNPSPGPFRSKLNAGEVFQSPTVFIGGFQDGPDGAGNILRKWVREVLGNAQAWKQSNYPLLVNNSWGSGMAVDERLALEMIHDSADLQFEMFHIDAGWFRGVGDWYPNPAKFPRGLAVIAEEAHKKGLKFGLWVDWTQAALDTAPGALNLRDPEVRDWLVSDVPPDWKPEEFKGQTIDIGQPAAKAWAKREVNRIVDDYHLDMLEHDGYLVAQGCDREDHPHAPPDPTATRIEKDWGSTFVLGPNSTDVSYHAVRAYYDVHDDLRRRHPGILLEICNDGGRMVDFGSAAHGDYFSITDTYDPLSNRRAFYDASHVLPPAMLETYVEKWPVPNIGNFRYMLRSGMMGWLTIMLDTTAWDQEQHRTAKEEFQIYRNLLRPLIRDALLFHISPRPDGIHWDGMEYFDPRRGNGVVYAFHASAEMEPSHDFVLKGLQPERRYVLHFQDGNSPRDSVLGRELLEKGLSVHLGQPNTSELIFIHEVREN